MKEKKEKQLTKVSKMAKKKPEVKKPEAAHAQKKKKAKTPVERWNLEWCEPFKDNEDSVVLGLVRDTANGIERKEIVLDVGAMAEDLAALLPDMVKYYSYESD